MADEQVQTTLSTDSAPNDVAPATEPSEAPSESGSSAPSWWQRLLNRGPREDRNQADQEGPDAAAASTKPDIESEEFNRRVQAETDRREAKRAAERARLQHRQLRDEDPWKYVQEEKEREAAAESEAVFLSQLHQIGSVHDRATIDPLLEMLPDKERDRILKLDGAGSGIQGRTLIIKEALKALEKHWKSGGGTDAERKLRENPAFRKQVLAEMRGEGVSEPDLLPSRSAVDSEQNLSRLLRDFYIG